MKRHNNLMGEISKHNLKYMDIAKVLGVHANTLTNKLNGITPFNVEEAFKIKESFFPESDLKYLFTADETDEPA